MMVTIALIRANAEIPNTVNVYLPFDALGMSEVSKSLVLLCKRTSQTEPSYPKSPALCHALYLDTDSD